MKDKKHKGIRAATSTLLSLVMATTLLGAIPNQAFAAPDDEQVFQLDIKIPDDSTNFYLPVNRQLSTPSYPYDWAIDWGDGFKQIAVGISSVSGGIPHTYSLAGDYSITIKPNGSNEAWLAAFGFGRLDIIMYEEASADDIYSSAALVTGAPSIINPLMTRTQAQVDCIDPSPNYEWALTFNGCVNLKVAPSFEGWEGIKWVGSNFASGMFTGCSSLTTLPEGFNLPQDLTFAGSNFASSMFSGCSSLEALPAGFNLPQSIEVSVDRFANGMFSGAGGPSFQINDEFCFPRVVYSPNNSSFNQTFSLSANAPIQNRTAASIIGDCPTPVTAVRTFDSHFKDLPYIPVNWGGGGLPRVGAPGSGDMDGDGFVTMGEVSICALAAIGAADLSPAQLDAIDIDRDGVITMADVMLIYKLAILRRAAWRNRGLIHRKV